MTREQAIKHLLDVLIKADWLSDYMIVALQKAIEALKDRPKGEWINKQTQADREGGYEFGFYCSKCGELCPSWIQEDGSRSMLRTRYCPNCGADMRGEKDE